jgi:hypothetical protein
MVGITEINQIKTGNLVKDKIEKANVRIRKVNKGGRGT